MELRQYIAILRRRKWIIIGATILGVLLAAGLSYLATPMYRSTTTLRVATVGSNITNGRTDISYTDRLMNTYSRIVTGGSAAGQIAQELGLAERPALTVELIPNTELMRISAEAPDPQIAQQVADSAAQILIARSRELFAGDNQTTIEILGRQIEQTESELSALRTQYEQLLVDEEADAARLNAASQNIALKERTYTTLLDEYEAVRLDEAVRTNAVSIVEPAFAPREPSKPRTELNIVLGLLVGLFAGVALALVRENLDTRLYTPGQIEAITKIPAIGRIPAAQNQPRLVGMDGMTTFQPQVEAFRRLRINLLSFVPDGQPYAMLVTSASEGEGKSTVTANLATAIAKSGRSVVVVDADMNDPSLHTIFNVSNDRGLTNFLTKQVGVGGILQETALSNLQVIACGSTMLEPAGFSGSPQLTPAGLSERLRHGSELLGSAQMRALLS
ncbi:MAG: P-loop NTPase, partial [Caldilineaceae bacterium]|nr:P-loop NTPase [Caldilineaceae bacterium]